MSIIVCAVCWDAYTAQPEEPCESSATPSQELAQPQGTTSRYNELYYCEVTAVSLVSHASPPSLMITFNVRGDGSLGPLQDPMLSRLHIRMNSDDDEGVDVSPVKISILQKDMYQIRGVLTFELDDCNDDLLTATVNFIFGQSGYSSAMLSLPGSRLVGGAGVPTCTGAHAMVITAFCRNGYEYGYVCNICRKHMSGERWHCLACKDDYCFQCKPAVANLIQCQKHHFMRVCASTPYAGALPSCDVCRRANIMNDGDAYHCKECKYDLCISCAQKQLNEK